MKTVVIAIMALGMAVSVSQPGRAQTLKVLHQFNVGQAGEGRLPHGKLLRDATGNLYGTTLDGGSNGAGSVFKLDPAGQETILLDFDTLVSGDSPDTPLVQDEAGNLFGEVQVGGPGNAGGVLFELPAEGGFDALHVFARGKNSPVIPTGGIFRDQSGNIFGTTIGGGHTCTVACGTIFRLNPGGKLRLLYKFTGGADGGSPFGPLVRDAEGNFYGVARDGGDLSCPDPFIAGLGCGTVFKLAPDGSFTVLHTFKGRRDGSAPQPGLLLDADGNLFGATLMGGHVDEGTVFEITKEGKYTVLHRFLRREGTNPNGGLVQDEFGNLYGTALSSGRHNLGTIFELTPGGELTVLHNFKLTTGGQPAAGLIRDEAGNLYGTTSGFGDGNIQGMVFELSF